MPRPHKNYRAAMDAFLDALEARGWAVARVNQQTGLRLKVPHATPPWINGRQDRLWFKGQSIHKGADLRESRSWLGLYYGLDLRETAVEKFLEIVDRTLTPSDPPARMHRTYGSPF